MAFSLLLGVLIGGCDSGSFHREGLACPLLRVPELKAGKVPPNLSDDTIDLDLP